MDCDCADTWKRLFSGSVTTSQPPTTVKPAGPLKKPGSPKLLRDVAPILRTIFPLVSYTVTMRALYCETKTSPVAPSTATPHGPETGLIQRGVPSTVVALSWFEPSLTEYRTWRVASRATPLGALPMLIGLKLE